MTDVFADFERKWNDELAAKVANEAYAHLQEAGMEHDVIGGDPHDANACVASIASRIALGMLREYDAFKAGRA